jgi:hypothetical protein
MVVPVFVEGDTEEWLIKRKLAQYLHDHGARKPLKVLNQGGAQKLISKIDKLVERALEQEGVDKVFCLLDFHQGSFKFPSPKSATELNQKVSAARDFVLGKLPKPNRNALHCHFSVHELEALFLCDAEVLQKRSKLAAAPSFPHPEDVDLDFPPKKRLDEFWQKGKKTSYSERIDGIQFIQALDIDLARSSCPFFNSFVDDLLEAAG